MEQNIQLQQITVPQKPENAFKPEMIDFAFSIAAFVLGYLFSRWVFFSWQGWGVSAFTTAYLLTITVYLVKKGAFVNNLASWFWMAVTWAAGASFTLWENAGFGGIRAMFLFCSAVYYVITASGNAIMGKTGNYLLIDGFNAVILIPFRNYFNQYVCFKVLGKREKRGKTLPIILGVMIALIIVAMLVPLLRSADSGGFSIIMDSFIDIFRFIDIDIIFYIGFAIPVAAYLYGLVSGAAHKKGTDIIKPEPAKEVVGIMRCLQPISIYIVLGAVSGLYLVFILSQIPYFFSAFTGTRPVGWLIYAEYARQGFFELCGIAAINLVVLTIGNITCKVSRKESPVLKALNIVLAIITLVLIATAFSKMALYIGVYGLTMPRLLPCVFMLFLAAVFVALIALQKWDFSIVRFALVTGAVMICAICLSNPDAMVIRYNTDRYLKGTLVSYDTNILYRAGSAGVLPAIEVYDSTTNEQTKRDIGSYLEHQKIRFASSNDHRWSLESHLASKGLQRVPDVNRENVR